MERPQPLTNLTSIKLNTTGQLDYEFMSSDLFAEACGKKFKLIGSIGKVMQTNYILCKFFRGIKQKFSKCKIAKRRKYWLPKFTILVKKKRF
jgi:hypothetical protein